MTNFKLFEIPDEIPPDKIIESLIASRRKMLESAQEIDGTLRDYVLRLSESAPESLLPALTQSQRKVLSFIISYWRANGHSPTSKEITEAMGFSSVTSAVFAMKTLQKKGYIEKRSRSWTSIVPMFNTKRKRIRCKTQS